MNITTNLHWEKIVVVTYLCLNNTKADGNSPLIKYCFWHRWTQIRYLGQWWGQGIFLEEGKVLAQKKIRKRVFIFSKGENSLALSAQAVFGTQGNEFIPKELGDEINTKILKRKITLKTDTLAEVCPIQTILVIQPWISEGHLTYYHTTYKSLVNKTLYCTKAFFFSIITNLFGHLSTDSDQNGKCKIFSL